MISRKRESASTPFPIRFVLQSGDAVLRGSNGAMWNVSFTPIIERLTRRREHPVFLLGRQPRRDDMPAGDPGRALGLHNTLTAMSKLIPPEGSPRRLSGYPTYAFGYGNTFFIALDSNIASDPFQLAWVTDQLEHLDRARYPARHRVLSSPAVFVGPARRRVGRRRCPAPAGRRRIASSRRRPRSGTLYMPLFRKHHVRLTDRRPRSPVRSLGRALRRSGQTHTGWTRLVTGGGGAPIYTYVGEPDLRALSRSGRARERAASST